MSQAPKPTPNNAPQLPSKALSARDVTLILEDRPSKALLRWITGRLSTFPYALRLSGCMGAASEKAGRQSEIIMLLSALKSAETPDFQGSISFTPVKVDKASESADSGQNVTRYSRTDQQLTLHTDSSYNPLPDSVMGFQCIEADREGGVSYFLPFDRVIKALSQVDIDRLSAPIFPFSPRHKDAILRRDGAGKPWIAYYRSQIDLHTEDQPLDADTVATLDRLDQLLTDESALISHQLQAGEMILINNHKILHGRSQLCADSKRLLYRGRVTLDLPRTKRALWPWPLSWMSGKKSPASPAWGDSDSPFALMLRHAEAGEYEQALQAAEADCAHSPERSDCHFWVAALAREAGDKQRAQKALAKATNLMPYKAVNKNPDAPSVMLLRSFNGSRYGVKQGPSVERKLSRGHFSTAALLNPSLGRQLYFNHYDQESWPVKTQNPRPAPELMINTVACADRMAESLRGLDQLITAAPPPKGVINPPHKVLRTRRDENAQRLSKVKGVIFPTTIRLKSDGQSVEDLLNSIDGSPLTYPLILRPSVTHTGKYVQRVQNTDEARSYFTSHEYWGDYYAIQFIHTKSDQGLYNKNRIFCINGRWYPVAGLHHDRWNIHSGDRYSVMDKTPALQQWEQGFLADLPAFMGESGMQALRDIQDLVDLDYFGIDFTRTDTGELLIFECNPAMRHNFDHVGNFPYTANSLKAISVAFSDMVAERLSLEDQ